MLEQLQPVDDIVRLNGLDCRALDFLRLRLVANENSNTGTMEYPSGTKTAPNPWANMFRLTA